MRRDRRVCLASGLLPVLLRRCDNPSSPRGGEQASAGLGCEQKRPGGGVCLQASSGLADGLQGGMIPTFSTTHPHGHMPTLSPFLTPSSCSYVMKGYSVSFQHPGPCHGWGGWLGGSTTTPEECAGLASLQSSCGTEVQYNFAGKGYYKITTETRRG